MQLQAAGNEVPPGQFLRFVCIRVTEWVRVGELGVDARTVSTKRYCVMLDRAMAGLMLGLKKQKLGWGYKTQLIEVRGAP